MNINKKWWKDFYAQQALWFGMACIGCAFYFFAPTLFTTEKSLIERNGEIEFVETYYNQVSSRGHKSIKSELRFAIKNDNKKYGVFKNIQQSRRNENYERIKNELNKSGKVAVWVKENEQSYVEPKVFRIANGQNEILYDMDDVKSELKFLFPFLLILGVFGIGLYFNHKYPTRMKSLIGKKPAHNKV
ncbi:hypothetical protein [Cochleicola gelatinilyticus]|uniref:DUF3592 domain-containing protein n=1 Tax=Cochleicola gelatinilyticus TaxID=1763537 RepID=A0A167K695_9FLAO|nr:hypothetical protein [Cochleicola gelatinilyticus]OAB81430.1 hypothetical protein ULVI_00995 [Cochleicola gelatinilyticus]